MERRNVNENSGIPTEPAAAAPRDKDQDVFFVFDFITGHKPWPGRSSFSADNGDVNKGKAFAAFGYLSFLFLVPLLAAKDNEFARFHGKQGMLLFAAGIVAWEAAVILIAARYFAPAGTPPFGALISLVILLVVTGAWLGLSFCGLIKAFRGRYWKIPVLGCLAERISI